jgi:3-deoxy-D-manno-octulosonate 8-phosphate phosphatase (KDO 8-P phosphatase)
MSDLPRETLAAIALVVTDVDGVLTDGRLYIGPDGLTLKSFTVHDGMACTLLHRCAIATAAITGRHDPGVAQRLASLGMTSVLEGIADKSGVLCHLAETMNLPLQQVLYVGDDVPDVPAMRLCGLAAAPADAHPSARRAAQWVTASRGGQGVLREIADTLLQARGIDPHEPTPPG